MEQELFLDCFREVYGKKKKGDGRGVLVTYRKAEENNIRNLFLLSIYFV